MPWVSVYDTVRDHPKIRSLSKTLNCSRHEAVGIMVFFWIWGLNNADGTGLITNIAAEDIADGIMCRSVQPGSLLKALIESGWLDKTDVDGAYIIHHWDIWQKEWYAAKEKRAKNAARMREARKKADSLQDSL